MSSDVRPLTERAAMAAYRKIVRGLARQRGYTFDELFVDHPVRQGGSEPPATWDKPVLVHEYGSWSTETTWAVVWESGPYEWVHYLDGGIEEEFGFRLPPIEMPAGVYVEPIESFSLGLYRED